MHVRCEKCVAICQRCFKKALWMVEIWKMTLNRTNQPTNHGSWLSLYLLKQLSIHGLISDMWGHLTSQQSHHCPTGHRRIYGLSWKWKITLRERKRLLERSNFNFPNIWEEGKVAPEKWWLEDKLVNNRRNWDRFRKVWKVGRDELSIQQYFGLAYLSLLKSSQVERRWRKSQVCWYFRPGTWYGKASCTMPQLFEANPNGGKGWIFLFKHLFFSIPWKSTTIFKNRGSLWKMINPY